MFEDLMDMEDGSYLEQTESCDLSPQVIRMASSGPRVEQSIPHTRHVDISAPIRMANSQAGAGSVIAKLEDILETVVDCMLGEEPLVIHLKTRSKSTKQILDPNTRVLKNDGSADTREISWPGKSQREAWKFCELLC